MAAQIGGAAPPDHLNTQQASVSSSGSHDSMICIHFYSQHNWEGIPASDPMEFDILKYGNYTVIDSHDETAYYDTHGFQEPVRLRFDDKPDKQPIPLIPGTELRMLVDDIISDTEEFLAYESYSQFIRGPDNDWD